MTPRVLVLVLLLLPALPLAASEETAQDWSDPRPFRLALELGEARDPLEGRAVALAADQLVLVPIDVTAALRDAGTWPFDAAGRPLAWTFAPESVRVVAAGSNATLPARFLPFQLATGGGEYDASANAAGTLAVVLPAGARAIHVYFEIAEHAQRPSLLPPEVDARLGEIAGLGPWVATLAHVPRTPPGETPALEIVSPDGPANVRVQRVQAGTAPSVLAQADVALAGSIALPPTDHGYDVVVTSDRPIAATLRTASSATGAFFHPALDGSAAGARFLLATPGVVQIVGTRAGTSVSVTDARSGASLAQATVGRLGTAPIEIPAGSVARVSASAPVLALQQGASTQGVDAFLHQGRSLDGAPSGALVVAARGGGHSVLADAPTSVQAFPLASPQSVTSARAGDAAQPAWVARSAPPPATAAWAFRAGAPLFVLSGSDGYAPIGGPGGVSFDVAIASSRDPATPAEHPMSGRLLAPFADTRVLAERRTLEGALAASGSLDLGALAALGTVPGTDADLATEAGTLRVEATKPILLTLFRPGAPSVAALPGLPPVVTASKATLEHFGAILAWSPLTSFHTARAGETTRIALTLSNLGLTREGEGVIENALLETRPLRTSRCRAEWEVSMPTATVDGLASGEQREVEAFVAVPEAAVPGDCMELEIVARSSYDPTVTSVARASIRARSGFQPELRVVGADGSLSTSTAISLEPGVMATVELRLRNLGSEEGVAIVRHARAPGYESRVVPRRDGEPVERVTLAGGGETRVFLEIEAPTGAEPPWDIIVQAASAADPSARDEVIVRATPRALVRLDVSAGPRPIAISPGASASGRIDVANLGGDAELRARLATVLPAGWNATLAPERLLLRAAGTRGDVGAKLDAGSFRVDLRAPADARVGETIPFAVEIGPPGNAQRVPLLAQVVNDLRLDLGAIPTITAGPTELGATVLELRSRAAAPMNVSLRSIGAPTGWNVSLDEREFVLLPGEARDLTVTHAVAPHAPAGPGTMALAFQLEDAITPARLAEFDLATLTTARAALDLRASGSRVALGPGERAPVQFTLRNDGNLAVPLDASQMGPIQLTGELPPTLAPGGSLSLSGLVGPGEGRAELTIGAARVGIDVVAATRDVRFVSASIRLADGVRFLDVEIENAGDLPSGPLALDIEAADVPRASVALPGLREGERARHTLLAPLGIERLSVRGASDLSDDAPGDNVWTFDPLSTPEPPLAGLAAARRAVPWPGVATLAAIALAWSWRRRA